MAEESKNKLIPTDEVIDAKIAAALEEPLLKLSEHDKSLAGKADSSSVYDKTTVDSKVKETGDAISEHVANNTRHITDSEREIWNNKPDSGEIYTRQQSDQRFSHVSHEHTNDGWFTSAINAVKTLIPTLPSWLTSTREEPPTRDFVLSVEYKANNARDAAQLAESKAESALVHADNALAVLEGKADEVKPSFSTITINGIDYTEWTLGTRSGKIMLSVNMGGISTEIAAFNPVTGVFVSAPSQYRNTLRFDGEAPVVGASPTLFDHVARESVLTGKLDKTDVVAPTGSTAIDTSKAAQAEATRVALAGKANSSDIPSLSGQTFDLSTDAQFKDMCIATARALGAIITHTTDDTSTGGQVAQAYGITPTDTTTFGELQTKAGLGDSAVIGDL